MRILPIVPDKDVELYKRSVLKFTFWKSLGAGSFGEVSCQRKRGRKYAIKTLLNPHGINPNFDNECDNETRIMILLKETKAPYTTKIKGYDDTFSNSYHIMMTYAPLGTLENLISNNPGLLTTKQAVHIIYRLSKALNHLHSLGLLHRDIKPANILLKDKKHPLLADFGLATTEFEATFSPKKGTPLYQATELLLNPKIYHNNTSTDIYSLGVVSFEILHRPIRAFEGAQDRQYLIDLHTLGYRAPISNNPKICPTPLKNLIWKMWSEKPDQRPRALQVLETTKEVKKTFRHTK